MSHAAPSAAPQSALRIWCDARYIYVELPASKSSDHSPPQVCVMSFSRDSAGLAKVLNLIYGHADNSAAMPQNYIIKKQLVGTPSQHSQAEAILRRHRIIK